MNRVQMLPETMICAKCGGTVRMFHRHQYTIMIVASYMCDTCKHHFDQVRFLDLPKLAEEKKQTNDEPSSSTDAGVQGH
jgi:DNA-directed RNA polymerase subunit RPC12/RpoP